MAQSAEESAIDQTRNYWRGGWTGISRGFFRSASPQDKMGNIAKWCGTGVELEKRKR
jgi:hypothetical protein